MPHASPATAESAGCPAGLAVAPPLTGKRRGNPELGLALRCGAHTRGGCPCRAPAIRGKRNPELGLALRCGAHTRGGCPCRAPAIRGKLRCRMHGGRSTGPRTEDGMARLRTARTVHGAFGAAMRALNRHSLTALRRGRVGNAAVGCFDRLAPDLAVRLLRMPTELLPPPWPSGGLTPVEDRAVLRAETEALAPWRAGIVLAGMTGRAGRKAAAVAGGFGAQAEPHAPECAGDKDAAALAASATARVAVQAEPHAPEFAGDAADAALAAAPTAGVAVQAEPHAPERAGDAAAAALAASATARLAVQAEPHAPECAASATALVATQAGPHAPECAGDAGDGTWAASTTALVATQAGPHAPECANDGDVAALAASATVGVAAQAEPHAPERANDGDAAGLAASATAGAAMQAKAHAPERGTAASDTIKVADAIVEALRPNRADRRRWMSLRRRTLNAAAGPRHAPRGDRGREVRPQLLTAVAGLAGTHRATADQALDPRGDATRGFQRTALPLASLP